ncbi:MAG: 50S ribosomal protein L30 [Chitinophagales bacterium]
MKLKVTWVKSSIGEPQDQKDTVKALGLRKMGQSAVLPDNPAVRGMIFKVKHLVAVEEVEG